jgi:tRNA A-37 threonylcarbamoyl transferase component Bud32
MSEQRDQPTAVTGYSPLAPDDELAPGTVVGEFRIECQLGRGGMGTVYGGIHGVIGKRGAIKVLKRELCTDQKEVRRFVQEARAVNQIGHGNIVDVFAFGELPDGRSYLVMEWLVGESLRTRMRKGPMTRHEVRDIVSDIVRALEATHAKGIIHRDLKPDNVFLVEAPGEKTRAKLLDFGLAKLTGDGRPNQTRVGSMLGTPQYIPPEQARGEADYRADIYALGVMVFEMIAGRPPFVGENTLDVLSMHLLERPPLLSTCAPEVSPELDALIDAMLAKEPAGRPALIRVRAEIERIAPAKPSKAFHTGVKTTARSSGGLKIAIGAAIGVVAMVIVFLVVRSSRSDDRETKREAKQEERAQRREVRQEANREARAETKPETPPPVAPAMGTLMLRWKGPAAARFSIAGAAVVPDQPIELPPGKHKVTIWLDKKPTTQEVTITAGTLSTVSLKPPPRAPSRNDLDPENNAPR